MPRALSLLTYAFVRTDSKMEKEWLETGLLLHSRIGGWEDGERGYFTYTLAPNSITLPPLMNAEAYGRFLEQTRTTLRAYTITIKTTIDCGDAENKVVFWSTGKAHFKDELMDNGLSEENGSTLGNT
jgi:hypothetical protein